MTLILKWGEVSQPVGLNWGAVQGTLQSVANALQTGEIAAIVGPVGPSGSAAGRYEHVQSVPSALWIVNHNLGLKPVAVHVVSVGGMEVNAAVTHISLNQLTIEFAVPYVGSARIL